MLVQKLSDSELLRRTKELVGRERELLTEILKHLREVERRRLFSDLKMKSLFEYTVKELGYGEDQAYRRIAAMRLIKELPLIEEKIEKGEISLSALGVANSLFRSEAKHAKRFSANQKLEVLEALQGRTKREAEEIAGQYSSLPLAVREPERLKSSIEGGLELRMQIDTDLLAKVQKVKSLLAHSNPSISTRDLLEKLCDKFLEDFERKMNPRKSLNSAPTRRPASGLGLH